MRRIPVATAAILAALAGLLGVVPATPAHGDHDGLLGHWHRKPNVYSSPPVYDRANIVRAGVNLPGDAAAYWRAVFDSKYSGPVRDRQVATVPS